MKSARMKRNFWLNSEIDCMLKIFQDIQLGQKNTITTHYTFVQIANNMRRKGFFNKTADQIKRKWFQMKSAYLCYKRGNIDRLLLIPEKFRRIIAEFVEFENKNSVHQNKESFSIQRNPINEECSNLHSDDVQSKFGQQNPWQLLKEYSDMQKALLKAELKYQYVRDLKWCKHFSSLSEHNKTTIK